MISDDNVSLYFGLRQGRAADLEVVSKAAIQWVNTVRLATEMIEPGTKVRVKIVDANEGSLSINAILDWGEQQLAALDRLQHPRLTKLAIALAVFLVIDGGPTLDYWLGQPDELELSDEDRELMNSLLDRISKSETLKEANRKFFKAVEADPAITSVGVCEKPSSPPIFSVPSDQFSERSGLWKDDDDDTRNSERVSDVILETPNLSEADRVWRFRDVVTDIPFTAKMRDEKFVQSLQQGGINENLRMGIRMKIRIQFKERRVGEEWKSVPSTIEVLEVMLEP